MALRYEIEKQLTAVQRGMKATHLRWFMNQYPVWKRRVDWGGSPKKDMIRAMTDYVLTGASYGTFSGGVSTEEQIRGRLVVMVEKLTAFRAEAEERDAKDKARKALEEQRRAERRAAFENLNKTTQKGVELLLVNTPLGDRLDQIQYGARGCVVPHKMLIALAQGYAIGVKE